jgi:hypothetical protein
MQSPMEGASGKFAPDTGPVLFTAYSTVEVRTPSLRTVPSSGAAGALQDAQFEPGGLPAGQALQNFYGALSALASGRRQQPVSILHLGGDQIVDDRFAGPLRDQLTSRFGNAGRGLMMPGLYPIRGMKVDHGGHWVFTSAASGSSGPYGITGARMTAGATDAWLRFTPAQGPVDWIEVTLMTGPGHGTAVIGVDNDMKSVPTAAAAANETSIRFTGKVHEISIRPRGDGDVTVLSVATGTNTSGISYSNLGLPGATAWTPAKWTADFAANELRKVSPDLIILTYGTHEGFDDHLDVHQYEMRLRLVLDQLREWAPQASVLIVGPPDAARLPAFAGAAGSQVCRALDAQEIAIYDKMMERSDERLARWHAPPRLEAVRAVLRRTAAASGAFYWDWARYMGGSCSIHAWTSSRPPMAAQDHETLTEAGNERSARGLFAEIMAGYDSYQRALAAKAQALAEAQAAAKTPQKKRR